MATPPSTTFNQTQASLTLSLAGSGRPDAASSIRRLLDAGVPPNISDGKGFTALASAVKAGDGDTVRLLLERGASVNLPTREARNPPLFWATSGTAQHDGVLQLLLDGRADANQQNVQGDSALLWACKSGAERAVTVLLKAAPNLRATANTLGMTALMCAAGSGSVATLQKLLLVDSGGSTMKMATDDLDAVDQYGRCALHFASDPQAVEALVRAGCDQRIRDTDGRTPLLEAQRQGNTAVANALQRAWDEAADDDVAARLPAETVSEKSSARSRGDRKKGGRARAKQAAPKPAAAIVAVAAAPEATESGSDSEEEPPALATAPHAIAQAPSAAVAAAPDEHLLPAEPSDDWVRVGRRGKASPSATSTQKGGAAEEAAEEDKEHHADADASSTNAGESTAKSAATYRAAAATSHSHPEGRAANASRLPHVEAVAQPADDAEPTTRAWTAFALRQPSLIALDVELRHLLGESLSELSMAQLTELLEVQKALVEKLQEAQLDLARRQEREVVEERMIQAFEKRLAETLGQAGAVS